MADISTLDLPDDEFLKQRAQLEASLPEGEEENHQKENKDNSEDEDDSANNEDKPDSEKQNEEDDPNQDDEDDPEGKSEEVEDEDDKKEDETKSDKDKPRDDKGKFTKESPKDEKEDKKVDDPKNKVEPNKAEETVDYEANWKELLKPIKANNRDFEIKSVSEARQLISMGLNYNKKMAGLKPHLAILKQLEGAELLDPEKLNFLIDISKGNPQAIAKLVADNKIDPLNINSDDANAYKPTDTRVADETVELDQVMDDLKDDPNFGKLMQIVGKDWDAKSKSEIAASPKHLRNLAAQMGNGMYDKIDAELQRRKLFGSIGNMSDLEAYREIGMELAKSGAFDSILNPTGSKEQPKPTAKAGAVIDPSTDEEKAREKQRKAAAPSRLTKPANKSKIPDNFNPLELSDEEFKKLDFKL